MGTVGNENFNKRVLIDFLPNTLVKSLELKFGCVLNFAKCVEQT